MRSWEKRDVVANLNIVLSTKVTRRKGRLGGIDNTEARDAKESK